MMQYEQQAGRLEKTSILFGAINPSKPNSPRAVMRSRFTLSKLLLKIAVLAAAAPLPLGAANQPAPGKAGAVVSAPASLLRAGTTAFPPLVAGKKIAFFGDSITQGGSYPYYLQLFLAGTGVEIYNIGVSGDTSASGLRRFNLVMSRLKPDLVCLIMGVNDAKDEAYTVSGPTPRKQQILDQYRANTDETIRRLLALKIAGFLSTPPPYDQYGTAVKVPNSICKNSEGLAGISEIDRELGAKYGLPVLELNDAMTQVYQQFPQAGFNADRTHPNRSIHVMTAALLARGMGLSPIVGRVAVSGGKAVADHAVVTDFRRDGNTIRYTYTPGRLPLGNFPEFADVRKYFALDDALNVETLSVADLAPGNYRLSAAGKELGVFSAADLKRGIRLAGLKTPGQQQADAMIPLLRQFEHEMALFAVNERFRFVVESATHKSYDDAANRRAFMKSWYEDGLKNEKLANNYRFLYQMFTDEIDGREAAIKARCVELQKKFYEQSKPNPFRMELEPVR